MRRFQKAFVRLIFATLLAAPSFASGPPPIPAAKMPPAVYPPQLNLPLPQPVRRPTPPPLTADQIRQFPVSGVLAGVLLANAAHASGLAVNNTSDDGMFLSTSVSSTHLRMHADAMSSSPVNITNDAQIDVEPSITSVKISTVAHTASASTKYVGGGYSTPRNFIQHSTDLLTFTSQELPRPAGYQLSGDPVLAVNPYTGGIGSKRLYCAGLLMNPGGAADISAIGVWRSDDGGQIWAGPTIVATQAGGNYTVDKPWIVVSWNTVSLGQVYVGWANIDFNTPNGTGNSVWVARSLDAGLSFPDRTVIAYGNVEGPQIVVNSNDSVGTVSYIWVDFTANQIQMAQSTQQAQTDTFGAHEVAAGGNLVLPANQYINGGIRAVTLPMARFNWVDGRIILTYHGYGTGGDLDVFYSYKPFSQSSNYYGWEQPKVVNDTTTNDQFMPGIDFNTTGSVIITYYDRRRTNNVSYEEFYSYLFDTGGHIQADQAFSQAASDPTPLPDFDPTVAGHQVMIGDYHEVWDTQDYPQGERSVNTWIGVISSWTDEYVSQISF